MHDLYLQIDIEDPFRKKLERQRRLLLLPHYNLSMHFYVALFQQRLYI